MTPDHPAEDAREAAGGWPTTEEWVARVLAVGDTLNAICTCGVPDGESEATDPRDRSVTLPHHFDCAAVTSWPVVADLIAAAQQRGAEEALRSAARDVGPALQSEVGGHTSTYSVRRWLERRALGGTAGEGEA